MPRAKRKPKPPSAPERDVQAACLACLRAHGFAPRRRNVGAMENASGRLVRFGRKGEADITATVPSGPNRGKRVEVEVKRPGESPRPEQLEFLRETNRQGGLAWWIDDPARLADVLRKVLDGATVEIDADGRQWLVTEDEERSA